MRQQRSTNEAVRLLYVACTRARQRLYLSACLQQKEKRQNPDSASLLCAIWPVLEPQLEIHDIPEVESVATSGFFRRPKQIPGLAPDTVAAAARPDAQPAPEEQTTDLPDIHRAAGILLHRMLEVWARYPARIPAELNDAMEQQWQRQLQHEGHDAASSEAAAGDIRRALNNLLGNPQRRHWLLEHPHQDSRVELPLATADEVGLQHWIVDRTFIESGVRHIIDYKLAEPAGDLQAFLAEETDRYLPQLKNYRDILVAQDGIPCRTYLYFPLIDHWQEVET